MKLKKYFPLIVLALLSCIILAALPAYQFFSSDYPKDITLKLTMALQNGLGLAAVILICLWLGERMDSLLARIKERTKRNVVSLVVYLASFFVCVVLPLISLFLVYGIFSPKEEWKQLPTPPEKPVAVSAGGQQSVVIETDKGNYYYCIVNNDLCWQPDNKPDSPALGEEYGIKVTGSMPRSAPPGNIVDMLGITYKIGPVDYETHYAILDDGTVWYLNVEVNNYSGSFMASLFAILVVPIAAGAVVVFIGAGISALARWVASRIWPESA